MQLNIFELIDNNNNNDLMLNFKLTNDYSLFKNKNLNNFTYSDCNVITKLKKSKRLYNSILKISSVTLVFYSNIANLKKQCLR